MPSLVSPQMYVLQMAADGWLGLGWPKEYGGQGRGFIDQFIFYDESMRAGAPVPMLTINSVAPTIMKYGSDEQKAFFLPKILAGEIHFSIGYTEPDAGTDLASLKTRAERDGDEWLINGQKIFTSLANFAQYVWIAARTDPDLPKHRGISMFIVPMDAPGVSVTPIMTMAGVRTNTTYYEDVRVPASALAGGEEKGLNKGWNMIMAQLDYERVSLVAPGMSFFNERAAPRTVRRLASSGCLVSAGPMISSARSLTPANTNTRPSSARASV